MGRRNLDAAVPGMPLEGTSRSQIHGSQPRLNAAHTAVGGGREQHGPLTAHQAVRELGGFD